jgi:hypothetical protein
MTHNSKYIKTVPRWWTVEGLMVSHAKVNEKFLADCNSDLDANY